MLIFSFFQFYLDGLCFTAPRTNHALRLSSFFSLFLSSVRVCVGVEAWWALVWGQRGYLWFISGHSSKKPVDAASLSHPLCPSHCFSIGLPLCRWHTGKRCPALPMLPSWSWSYSGHTHWLPAKRTNSDRPHSAQLAPPSYLALQLPVLYLFLDLSLPTGTQTNASTPVVNGERARSCHWNFPQKRVVCILFIRFHLPSRKRRGSIE